MHLRVAYKQPERIRDMKDSSLETIQIEEEIGNNLEDTHTYTKKKRAKETW